MIDVFSVIKRIVGCIGLAFLVLPNSAFSKDDHGAKTKLILQITVDQFRGDLLQRYHRHLGKGGFQYLMNNGIYYRNANHSHANTETIVGHATLATGAHPADHGLIGNLWYDRSQQAVVYNIEDPNYPLLSADADVDDKTEIDPTQRAARSDGRSPASIAVTTFSDELVLKSAGKAKVYGVSVKDRGAVSMAGHAGKAFWFSKAAGQFVTSHYYYDAYPDWVKDFNRQDPTKPYQNNQWQLTKTPADYLFGARDDQEWETALPGYGRTFPHAFGDRNNKYFTTFLTLSPAGDEMVLAFAKALMQKEQLGVDSETDYLSLSFSSTDYVGHIFGPSSLEAEDNFLRLDRTLADLFNYVDEHVGLKNTLIVLSADHGGPETPGTLAEYGFKKDYVDPNQWDKHKAIVQLKNKFGIRAKLIQSFTPPYLYLNPAAVKQANVSKDALELAIAEALTQFDGVHQAFSSGALAKGQIATTHITQAVLNNFHPDRSGDLFIVFEPHRFINDFDGLVVASTHGSPWRYDTHVPIIFAGAKLKAKQVYRPVSTRDVALTLSAWAGTNQPSGASGEILWEVLAK